MPLTVTCERTSQVVRANATAAPTKIVMLTVRLLYMFNMNTEHDDRHDGTHEQRHPRSGLAEIHVVPDVGMDVHQPEHHQGGRGNHRGETPVAHVHMFTFGLRRNATGLRLSGRSQRTRRSRSALPITDT